MLFQVTTLSIVFLISCADVQLRIRSLIHSLFIFARILRRQAEAIASRLRPKFWYRDQFGLKYLTSLK